MRPLPADVDGESTPSTITNSGLHVKLLLVPAEINSATVGKDEEELEGQFDAVLDCAPYANDSGTVVRAAIRLISLGGDQFARIHSDRILTVSGNLDVQMYPSIDTSTLVNNLALSFQTSYFSLIRVSA